jgi:hypothetical protein
MANTPDSVDVAASSKPIAAIEAGETAFSAMSIELRIELARRFLRTHIRAATSMPACTAALLLELLSAERKDVARIEQPPSGAVH